MIGPTASIAVWFALSSVVSTDPPDKGSTQFPGADAWGDVRLIREQMPATNFAIAPGANEIAFFGYTKAFHIYDLTLGRIGRMVPCDETVHDLAYSPDGKLIATAQWFSGVKLHEPTTGKVVETLEPDEELGVSYATFLPDGRLAAYCWRADAGQGSRMREQLFLWDVAAKRKLGWNLTERVETGGEMIRRRFVGAGRHLLSLETKTKSGYVVSRAATLTNPANNKISTRVVLDMDDDFVFDASPDGRTLLVFNLNRPPRLVDVDTGKTMHLLVGHEQYVTCGAFAPDGKLVATASGITRRTNLAPKALPPPAKPTEVILWEASTGRKIATLRDTLRRHDFAKVGFSPDGTFLVALAKGEDPRSRDRKGGEMILWGRLPALRTKAEPPRLQDPQPFALSDRIDRLVQDLTTSDRTMDQKVEAMFLAILGRFPTREERLRATATFTKSAADPAAWRRLSEALTATSEFREHAEGLLKRLGDMKPAAPR